MRINDLCREGNSGFFAGEYSTCILLLLHRQYNNPAEDAAPNPSDCLSMHTAQAAPASTTEMPHDALI